MKNRKTVLTFMAALCAVVFIATCAMADAPSGKKAVPRISERKYKFDPVLEGTRVTHDFIVENIGDAPLIIKEVKTG